MTDVTEQIRKRVPELPDGMTVRLAFDNRADFDGPVSLSMREVLPKHIKVLNRSYSSPSNRELRQMIKDFDDQALMVPRG